MTETTEVIKVPLKPITITLTWTKENNPFIWSFECVPTTWISEHIEKFAKEFEPQGALVDSTATVLTEEKGIKYVYMWKVLKGEAIYVTRTTVMRLE